MGSKAVGSFTFVILLHSTALGKVGTELLTGGTACAKALVGRN